ncbi:MAG: ABC transporter ATP-binding protein [Deltaproteobacteria bacterium]|nr:ABC transporter ATP-binding protein [Deltaproteobacteria bacterium]
MALAMQQQRIEPTTQPTAESVAIELRNVTVAYRSYKERPTTLKESIIRSVRTRSLRHFSTFNALSDVSFQIPRGSVTGIIGSNGSGKSTLLKVLAGVLRPSKGFVNVNGSIGSLIELGIGFDPEMNAVENILLNGSLHRRTSEEMRTRIPNILAFSELEEFSTTPIKYYSSGMLARLGFATAIDIDPDVLLVDEVLGVGDERFQNRCHEVFRRFFESEKTIVMVSHDLEMLQKKTQRIILVSRGHIVFDGDPETAVRMYRDNSYETALRKNV